MTSIVHYLTNLHFFKAENFIFLKIKIDNFSFHKQNQMQKILNEFKFIVKVALMVPVLLCIKVFQLVSRFLKGIWQLLNGNVFFKLTSL